LHRALHDDDAVGWCRTGAALNERTRTMLDELPLGADIASPQPGGPAVHGFTRSNRFMRDAVTAYTGEPGSEGYRFNGLDYLLLHNLYALATPATWEGGSGSGVPECSQPPDGGTTSAAGETDEGGCGCRTAPTQPIGGSLWWLGLWLAVRRRRDRSS
jgi:hypothetical protein